MFRARLVCVLFSLLAGMPLLRAAEDAMRAGAQVTVGVPTSPDLKLTTGSPGGGIGVHLTWPLGPVLVLRPRLDAQWFSQGRQRSQAGGLDQELQTRVSSLGPGADLLLALPGLGSGTRLGLSIQELRWQVASVNTLRTASGGSSEVAGTSTWWRFAWGPVVTYQVNNQLELEGRLSLSRYGQENQPAHTAALGVLWHF